jgi:CHAT domain-containing protein
MYSQSYSKIYDNIKINSNDLKITTDSIILLAMSNKEFLEAAAVAHDYSIKMYLERDFEEAIEYAKKEVENFKKSNVKDNNYTNAIYNLAFFYRNNAQYELSIKMYELVISEGTDSVKIAESYGGIGTNYFLQDNYKKAISFLNKSIKDLKKLKAYRNLFSQQLNLSNIYVRLEDSLSIKKGLKLANDMESLREKIKFSMDLERSVNSIYANLYSIYGNNFFEESKKYYQKNIQLNKSLNDSLNLGRTYSSLNYLYNSQKNDSASYYAKVAIKLLDSNLRSLTIAYVNYIDYLLLEGKNYEAIIVSDSIIDITKKRLGNKSSLKEVDLNKLPSKRHILFLLNQRLEAFVKSYQTSKDSHFLNRVFDESHLYFIITKSIDESSNSDYDKLYWRKKASQAYLYGAYAAHLLGDSEKAFSFMEKNKALLLSESVLKNTEFANLPRHISEEETRRQKLIYELENSLAQDEDNRILQDSLFTAKRSYEQYVDSLKAIYPKYYARKINVTQVPLSQVKDEISNDQAVVSYIWNDFDQDKELIIGFVTTKDESTTFEVQDVPELRSLITQYQELISRPFATEKDRKKYQEVAFKLYEKLFPTEQVVSMIQNKDMTIIADGDLQNMPFESLISKENSNEYLILNEDIHYSYSYSFLKHNEKVKRSTTSNFIGYSPVNFDSLQLSDLKNSKTEIEKIHDELNGELRLQDSATKRDFLSTSTDAKIIHLATHADAGENPWIAFSDEKLELHELYTYKNNADLVTLSACNTSLGEMAKGEGVLSLARGFFHSGSKSVVSSLWKVNDKATSEIMTSFYDYLKEGQTKSEAINNAKRAYLNNHSLSEQSPYYWSSFILIGDAGTVELASSNLYVYLLIVGVIVVSIFTFRKKIKIVG